MEELEKLESYNPYGKAGSGAPNRDLNGNIVASRKPATITANYSLPADKEEQRKAYERELKEQIREKNEKIMMQNQAKKEQEELEERRIKEELDLINQKDKASIMKEKGL